ncbi:MAG: ATPase, T2SS/T4P/T4SS family [Pseudomonadota bacterium]
MAADMNELDAAETSGISLAYAERHGVLLDYSEKGDLTLICRTDTSLRALQEAQRRAGCYGRIRRLDAETFAQRLQIQQDSSANQAMTAIDEISDAVTLDFDRLVGELNDQPENLLDSIEDAPIIRLLNALFTKAVQMNASDLHIEQYEDYLRVRMRVDGELQQMMRSKRSLAPLLISRIKVMARLDIAEKRLPQDGRIALRLGRRQVDVRVSTMPSGVGERAVLRLLDKSAGRLQLRDLGMPSQFERQLDQIIRKPHGMFLVTGPTGSGKTTTLYAALTRLNDHRRNIMTVEDPIEYDLEGINQAQINAKIGMSFAHGLRAILRQDPDVVMVGEIRDGETSEIAVQASLTGHMVFSTLHTNTAIGAVIRLRDMGVEPFLLASSLSGILAQRLVRQLCTCAETYQPDVAERERLGIRAGNSLLRPKGCDTCNQSGYLGRIGVYELITMDDILRGHIHAEASEATMLGHVRQQTPALIDSAMSLVRQHKTSYEEVLRVLGT